MSTWFPSPCSSTCVGQPKPALLGWWHLRRSVKNWIPRNLWKRSGKKVTGMQWQSYSWGWILTRRGFRNQSSLIHLINTHVYSHQTARGCRVVVSPKKPNVGEFLQRDLGYREEKKVLHCGDWWGMAQRKWTQGVRLDCVLVSEYYILSQVFDLSQICKYGSCMRLTLLWLWNSSHCKTRAKIQGAKSRCMALGDSHTRPTYQSHCCTCTTTP